MNINNYLHLLVILDSDESTNTTNYENVISQDAIDEARRQCFIWNLEDKYSILGRQYKSTVRGLYPLLYHIRKYTNNNIVYISQTDKNLLPFYNNSHTNIHYAIHKLLIDKAKVLWDLKSEYKAHNKAKYYYVCSENLDTMFKIYESVVTSQSKAIVTDGGTSKHLIPVYYSFPSFNSDLEIHEDYSFEEVKETIIMRYPCIPYYSDLVNKLNEHAVNYDERIRFEISPQFSSKGKITKLKIRAFSGTCLLKSLEKQEKKCRLQGIEFVVDNNTRYREHYLNERFGEWEEYDIKGSVPRVSRAMAEYGDMGDLNEDIYQTIFEPFVKDYHNYFDSTVTEWCDSVRNFFKLLFMRLFFGGTPKQIVNNILSSEKKKTNKAIKDRVSDINLSPFSSLKNRGVDLELLIDKYQRRVFEVCHRTYENKRDTSVFLHESCIYLEVRKELFKRGIDVVQVYDGFYFKKGTLPPDMDEIIQLSALRYYNINNKIVKLNAIENISKSLCETPITKLRISERVSTLSYTDVIDTGIEFIDPNKQKSNFNIKQCKI